MAEPLAVTQADLNSLADISSRNFAERLRRGDDSILGLESINSRDVLRAISRARKDASREIAADIRALKKERE